MRKTILLLLLSMSGITSAGDMYFYTQLNDGNHYYSNAEPGCLAAYTQFDAGYAIETAYVGCVDYGGYYKFSYNKVDPPVGPYFNGPYTYGPIECTGATNIYFSGIEMGPACTETPPPPPPPACEAGEVIQFTVDKGETTLPCYQGCQWTPMGTGVVDEYGAVTREYLSTINSCTITEADPVDQIEGWECRRLNGVDFCGFSAPGEQCGSINGVYICVVFGNCGSLNGGDVFCPEMLKNCGEFNGKYVCIQPPEGNIMGPQNTDPAGCIVNESGDEVCANDVKITKEETEVEITDNGDGTETTVITSTTTINVAGEQDIVETITDDGYGNTSRTIEEKTPAEGSVPEQPQFEDVVGWQSYVDALGTAELGASSFINPLDLPDGFSCQQLPFGIAGYSTTFPGSIGCFLMHRLREILAWAVYLYTFYYLASLAMRRVS